MPEHRILIVDDEPPIRQLIGMHARNAGIAHSEAANGRSALEMLEQQTFDLILLDLMMDDTDGMEVLRLARSQKINTPIIIVSAIDDIDIKIDSLGLGADDYVTKPFIPSELIARIEANIRRSRNLLSASRIETGDIRLNLSSQTVEKNGLQHSLSPTECELLALLMRHPGHILTKEEIYQSIWNHKQFDANNLSVYMNYLRRKIEDNPQNPQYIITIRGIGYRFEGAVT